jgi:hypothetical protein
VLGISASTAPPWAGALLRRSQGAARV